MRFDLLTVAMLSALSALPELQAYSLVSAILAKSAYSFADSAWLSRMLWPRYARKPFSSSG